MTMQLEHIEAVLRGYWPRWMAMMRAWTGEEFMLYGVLLLSMLLTLRTLNRCK